jgi:hypothetical protein
MNNRRPVMLKQFKVTVNIKPNLEPSEKQIAAKEEFYKRVFKDIEIDSIQKTEIIRK